MRTRFLFGLLLVAVGGTAHARGVLIPTEKTLPPLAMVHHKVTAAIDDQVAVTVVEQSFRNHTDRQLEATYIFPVPRGASVNKFTMWVDGKETTGELLDAKKANHIYTEIVRRTQDPGILEYLGNGLMRLRVFPILPKSDQKVKIAFTAICQQESGVVEYLYPLKTDSFGSRTLEEFSVKISLKSQHPIQSVYSPSHAIDIKRNGDREVNVEFQKNQAMLDKDFQLFYGVGGQEVGLTPLVYRPVSSEDGYFLMLISPQTESMKANRIPRDLVLVLDTSGSMSDLKLSQAKKALRYCLGQLTSDDRFALVSFATAVRTFKDEFTPATKEQLERADKWVSDLRTSGGTAIQPALDTALGFRGKDASRSFTVAFFTDGQPTVDETNPDKIVKNVVGKNSENTRIFTFGVGDDVNAAMLDQLSEATRAVSTYVRPAEDIEVKASALYAKISHPVMTNVRMTTTNITVSEVYPQRLPDLFHGGQLVVLGRYNGQGAAAIKLTGMVGKEEKELVYELTFPTKTDDSKDFVEQLWARRKVGFLLDQIRINGESKELVDEVTAIAKKYGIATPYTSYLVVPDGPMPSPVPRPGPHPMPSLRSALPSAIQPAPGAGGAAAAPRKVSDLAKELASEKGDGRNNLGEARDALQDRQLRETLARLPADQKNNAYAKALEQVQEQKKQLKDAQSNYQAGKLRENQSGKLGVDLALSCSTLRNQNQLTQSANRTVYGRQCTEVGGVWVDDQFNVKAKTVVVKAQSNAYFRILERQPKMKDVYQLGNHFVWITPSGTALIVDANDGSEELADPAIDALFASAK